MSTSMEYANNLDPILELPKLGSDNEKSYSWSIQNVLTIPVNIDFAGICDNPWACTYVADDVASNYSSEASSYSLNVSPITGGSNAMTIPTLTVMNSSSQNGSLAKYSSPVPNSSPMPSHFSHESFWRALLDQWNFRSSISSRLDVNQLVPFSREPRVNQPELVNIDTCSQVHFQDAQSFGEHMNSHSQEPKRNGKRNQSLDNILSSRMDKSKKSKNNSGNASYGSTSTMAISISNEQEPIMHQRREDSERQIMANNASGSTTSTSKNNKRKEHQI